MKIRWRGLLAGALLSALAAGVAVYLGWRDMQRNLDAPIALDAPELFEIAPGTSITRLARAFVARGWLRYAIYFRIEAMQSGLASRIQAGFYELRPGENLRGLLRRFAEGDVKTYAVTFVEGSTVRDILTQTAGLDGLVHELQGATPEAVMDAIGAPDQPAEGWLFPSTYFYHHATTDRQLLKRAHRKMVDTLNTLWEQRAEDLPYASAYEALIMASIIEKETGLAAERREIAGVFVRRLQQGMRLQTDPTVIYGLGEHYDGNLRRVDLERDSPYNTYVRSGLPPTPICSPGAASIEASLHPSPGNALYFVARGDGSHVFSATLDAHNAAVREHQLRRR